MCFGIVSTTQPFLKGKKTIRNLWWEWMKCLVGIKEFSISISSVIVAFVTRTF